MGFGMADESFGGMDRVLAGQYNALHNRYRDGADLLCPTPSIRGAGVRKLKKNLRMSKKSSNFAAQNWYGNMIEVKDLWRSFGTLDVLKGVNLKVEKGEIVAIVGKSGAGKTTLLQIIGTLDKPTRGEVIIGDWSLVIGDRSSAKDEKELAAFRNKHIGFIFQFHQLLPEFTALENVCIPAMIAREKEAEYKPRAERLLRDLGLGERMHHKPNELSGGEKQRVAAARALMMSPDIILADEPTGSLDTQNKKELSELLLKLRKEYGQTILLVTHDKELAGIADRVIEIKDGVII